MPWSRTVASASACMERNSRVRCRPGSRPRCANVSTALAALGVTIEDARLDDVSLHQALLRDPSGQPLRLLEARTFSPPALSPAHSSALGYFEEFALATPDLAAASAFWERLGFVAFEPVREPFAKAVAASRDLNVGLYAIDLQAPVLVFTDAAMPERIASLRDQGHRFAQRMPRELAAIGAAMLEAPEGTQLLLLSGTRGRLIAPGDDGRNLEADLERVRDLDGAASDRERRDAEIGLVQPQLTARDHEPSASRSTTTGISCSRSTPFSVTATRTMGCGQTPARRRGAQRDGRENAPRRAPRRAACCGACRPARRPAPAQRTPGPPRRALRAGPPRSVRPAGSAQRTNPPALLPSQTEPASSAEVITWSWPSLRERAGPADDDGDDGPLRVDLQACACPHVSSSAAASADCDCEAFADGGGAEVERQPARIASAASHGAAACACRVFPRVC